MRYIWEFKLGAEQTTLLQLSSIYYSVSEDKTKGTYKRTLHNEFVYPEETGK